jgi:hypothetical protein
VIFFKRTKKNWTTLKKNVPYKFSCYPNQIRIRIRIWYTFSGSEVGGQKGGEKKEKRKRKEKEL